MSKSKVALETTKGEQTLAELTAKYEINLPQFLRLHDRNSQPLDSRLTLGEVTGVHISRAFLDDDAYQTAATHHHSFSI